MILLSGSFVLHFDSHSAYFIRQFLVFVLFVGYCLARLCVLGTTMYIEKVFYVFLFMRVMSGRLEGTVLSVIILRFQNSLKLSFSSTLAGVYL
jgi:hypothetical protein